MWWVYQAMRKEETEFLHVSLWCLFFPPEKSESRISLWWWRLNACGLPWGNSGNNELPEKRGNARSALIFKTKQNRTMFLERDTSSTILIFYFAKIAWWLSQVQVEVSTDGLWNVPAVVVGHTWGKEIGTFRIRCFLPSLPSQSTSLSNDAFSMTSK